LAIKANVYLTWASPRFNEADDLARWDSAAVYARGSSILRELSTILQAVTASGKQVL